MRSAIKTVAFLVWLLCFACDRFPFPIKYSRYQAVIEFIVQWIHRRLTIIMLIIWMQPHRQTQKITESIFNRNHDTFCGWQSKEQHVMKTHLVSFVLLDSIVCPIPTHKPCRCLNRNGTFCSAGSIVRIDFFFMWQFHHSFFHFHFSHSSFSPSLFFRHIAAG